MIPPHGDRVRPGDRVRVVSTAEDGLPLVRYGVVDGTAGRHGPLAVTLDGQVTSELLDLSEVSMVSIDTVELCLEGTDLVDDIALRRGLVALWAAEADTAGLDIASLHPLGDGLRDSSDTWAIAELVAGSEQYVLRVHRTLAAQGVMTGVVVRADRPNRWDW